MKITSISIKDDNTVLNDFHWKSDMPINIFIGENGSGKTTILKNLVWIFRGAYDLFINRPKSYSIPSFQFEINYIIIITNNEKINDFETNYVAIRLFSTPTEKNFCDIEVSNTRYTKEELISKFGYKALLPTNIIAYYSGWDDKIKSIFKEVEDGYKNLMIKELNRIDNGYSVIDEMPFIYIEKIHFQILLACLFSFEYNLDLNEYLEQKFKISFIDNNHCNVNIFIKRPEENFYSANYDDFWGAKGELRTFLDVLKKLCDNEPSYNSTQEHLILSFNYKAWINLREFYGTEKRLYFYFHLLNSSGFLDGFHIYFLKDNKIQSNHNLSEGEQQLLTILGLREILYEMNSLLLLDEPDTFLHPRWQQEFITDLCYNMEYPKGDEFKPFHNEPNFFITSHSLNLLNNANKDLVKVTLMEEGKESDRSLKFYGKTISSINYNLMGIENRPIEIQNKFNLLFKLLELDKLNESKEIYNQLVDEIGQDDEELLRAKIELDFLTSIDGTNK